MNMENFDQKYKERKAKAEERASALARELMNAGRQEDLFRAAENSTFRDKLYEEYEL